MREVHEFRVWNRLKSSKSSISFHSARCVSVPCILNLTDSWRNVLHTHKQAIKLTSSAEDGPSRGDVARAIIMAIEIYYTYLYILYISLSMNGHSLPFQILFKDYKQISLGIKHGNYQISFESITKLKKCLTKYFTEFILLNMFWKDLILIFRIRVNSVH